MGAADAKLTSSFANAAVGDFNGDGRDDIAVGTFSQWRYSPGGNAPLVTLRSGGFMPSLKSVQIGRFDTTRNAGAITFVGDRLARVALRPRQPVLHAVAAGHALRSRATPPRPPARSGRRSPCH